MIIIKGSAKIYLYTPVVDMRKAIDGLVVMICESMESEPQSGDVFIFRNKSSDKVKMIYWDGNGFVMHYKRLEKGRFKFPRLFEQAKFEVTEEQLSWLLAGLDFVLMNEFSELNYEHYF